MQRAHRTEAEDGVICYVIGLMVTEKALGGFFQGAHMNTRRGGVQRVMLKARGKDKLQKDRPLRGGNEEPMYKLISSATSGRVKRKQLV